MRVSQEAKQKVERIADARGGRALNDTFRWLIDVALELVLAERSNGTNVEFCRPPDLVTTSLVADSQRPKLLRAGRVERRKRA